MKKEIEEIAKQVFDVDRLSELDALVLLNLMYDNFDTVYDFEGPEAYVYYVHYTVDVYRNSKYLPRAVKRVVMLISDNQCDKAENIFWKAVERFHHSMIHISDYEEDVDSIISDTYDVLREFANQKVLK